MMDLDSTNNQFAQISESETSDAETNSVMASDHELLLKESETLSSQDLSKESKPSNTSKLKSLCTNVNWKGIMASVCLWIAYFLCAAGFSTIGPFFPDEVGEFGLAISS